MSLAAWRPTDRSVALGLAVEYLAQKPAFAALPLGEWTQVLLHQIARQHYLFVIDPERRIHGFLGWTLSERDYAEAWAAGRAGLYHEGAEGDCVIVNAWAADDPATQTYLRRAANALFAGYAAVYFKRHYSDGRERPMRLVIPAHRRKNRP
jgi:hemolysin-activating ACP:hemolysin acyltransferase